MILAPYLGLVALLVRDLPDRPSEAEWRVFRARLWRATVDARRKAHAVARRQYREHSKYGFQPVIPLPYYPPRVFEAAVQEFVAKPIAEGARTGVQPDRNQMIETLQGRMASHVHGVSRETTDRLIEQENEYLAERDDTEDRVGWARILQGESSCAFCVMLASRGAVYSSRQDALFNQYGKKFHDRCDCDAWPVYRSQRRSWPGKKEADAYYRLWLDVTEGLSGKRARNAFRRYIDAQRRAGKTKARDLIAA